jgi:hypothetical protein
MAFRIFRPSSSGKEPPVIIAHYRSDCVGTSPLGAIGHARDQAAARESQLSGSKLKAESKWSGRGISAGSFAAHGSTATASSRPAASPSGRAGHANTRR